MAGLGAARLGRAWRLWCVTVCPGRVGFGWARLVKAVVAWLGEPGRSRCGVAWHGPVSQGELRRSRCGKVCLGLIGLGWARSGRAVVMWQGTAR